MMLNNVYVDTLTQPLNQQVIKYFAITPEGALNHSVSQVIVSIEGDKTTERECVQ